MKKIKILRIIHTMDPRHGGPQNAIIDNSLALIKKGFSIDILTSDSKFFFENKKSQIKIFNLGPSIFEYGLNIKLIMWLINNKKKYDFFIIEGLWSFYSFIARVLLKKRYFVFSHGQLDPFFGLNTFKKIKKKIYWKFIEKKNLIYANSLFVTTNKEKKLLSNTYVKTNKIKKKNVGYGILKPKYKKEIVKKIFYSKYPYLKNKRFLIFLGRFHEKKGCNILLKSLHLLKLKNIKIYLFLAGPGNDYKNRLYHLSKKLNLENQIFWSDNIKGKLKWGALYSSNGMVLSSNGENFGVSLAESLSCGKPVLTTYRVNIYDKILKHKCGLVSKNNPVSFSKILYKYYKFNKKILKNYSKNSTKCFDKEFNLTNNINIFAEYLKNEYAKLENY